MFAVQFASNPEDPDKMVEILANDPMILNYRKLSVYKRTFKAILDFALQHDPPVVEVFFPSR